MLIGGEIHSMLFQDKMAASKLQNFSFFPVLTLFVSYIGYCHTTKVSYKSIRCAV